MTGEPAERVPPMAETMEAIMETFVEIQGYLWVIGERCGLPPELLALHLPDRRTLG